MKSGTTIQPIQLVAVVKMMESFALTRRKIMWKKFFLKYSARKQSGATMYTWTGTGTGSIEHFILWPQQTQIVIPNYVVSNKQFSFIANDVSTN